MFDRPTRPEMVTLRLTVESMRHQILTMLTSEESKAAIEASVAAAISEEALTRALAAEVARALDATVKSVAQAAVRDHEGLRTWMKSAAMAAIDREVSEWEARQGR